MRAAVFKGRGRPLQIEEVADPLPGPNDLILKVKNCGLCGSDLHLTEPTSTLPLLPGAILGHEFAGEVIEIGAAVRHLWHIGDRIAGFPAICCGDSSPCSNQSRRFSCLRMLTIGLGTAPGAYAEYVRISAGSAHRLPDQVSFREGSLVEPLAVGLHAVDKARMPRGATVLVLGAGPVGLAIVLFARLLGARHVIVSEKTAARRELAARLGATAAVDPARPLRPQVQELAGTAPDVIFECVGAPGMLDTAMAEAPHGGQVVVAGVCQQPDTVRPLLGIAKELTIQFVLAYTPADFHYVIELLAARRIDAMPLITDIIDLAGLPAAFEALRTPTHQCKVLLEP